MSQSSAGMSQVCAGVCSSVFVMDEQKQESEGNLVFQDFSDVLDYLHHLEGVEVRSEVWHQKI